MNSNMQVKLFGSNLVTGPKSCHTEAAVWDIDFKLFIKKQKAQRNFDTRPPSPAQEIQTEKPVSGRRV